MTIALFITLLTIFSAITGVCTEAIKKLLGAKSFHYSANVLAFIVACIVGMGGTTVYYVLNGIAFTSANIICLILMGIAVAMGAMVGYDKIIQTINQFKGE